MEANRKKIAASVLLIAASIALLLGLTFAWFTDSVTNKGNKIQAGTLDVQLWDGDVEITSSSAPVFDYAKWEPGYSDGANLKVVNAGTLALKYELRFRVADARNSKGIENVVDVTVDGRPVGTVADFLGEDSFDAGVLQAGQQGVQKTVTLRMSEAAGNEFQGAAASFDILLVATQATSEKDGFGSDQYDANAAFPWDGASTTPVVPDASGAYNLSTAYELAWISEQVRNGSLANQPITVVLQDDIDLEGREWTPIGGDDAFCGTFDGNGHVIKNLTASKNLSSSDEARGIALIGYAENATIKNLTIDNCDMQGRYAVAAVVGDGCAPLTFENIEVTGGAIVANKNVGNKIGQVAGGILGQGWGPDGSSIVFRNCVNRADVTVNKWHAGGLWGSVTVSGGETVDLIKVENCANYGAIGSLGEGYAGGLGAYAVVDDCVITGCENHGAIASTKEPSSEFVAYFNGNKIEGNTE